MGLLYPVRFGGFLRVQHGDAAAITAVTEDYQEETANEDEKTIFRHPAQPCDGTGADAGDGADGVCG